MRRTVVGALPVVLLAALAGASLKASTVPNRHAAASVATTSDKTRPAAESGAAPSTAPSAPNSGQGAAPATSPGSNAGGAPTTAAPAKPAADVDDTEIDLVEPDYTIVTLPTNARLPNHRSAFRVTHRFGRPLNEGSFGSLVGDLFGLDAGAQIGLEYRYAVMKGTQLGFHRTNFQKTIEFFAQQSLLRQGASRSFSLDVVGSVEGTNNFRDRYSSALGLVLSRKVGPHAAFYLEPFWAINTNPLPKELAHHNDTFMLAFGGRLRVRPSVYLVGEVVPRLAGFGPGTAHANFGIEKRVGGHVFQLSVSDSFATTLAGIALGAAEPRHWYLGFNISRKFF